MSHRRMTRVIERIADEPRFAERFRADPDGTVRRYRLKADQVQAIKAGDAASLAAHGVDVAGFAAGRRSGMRSRLMRVGAAAGLALSALGISAAPASAQQQVPSARRLSIRIDGIWNLDQAREQSADAANVGGKMWDVEVPTEGVPGKGRPFQAHSG